MSQRARVHQTTTPASYTFTKPTTVHPQQYQQTPYVNAYSNQYSITYAFFNHDPPNDLTTYTGSPTESAITTPRSFLPHPSQLHVPSLYVYFLKRNNLHIFPTSSLFESHPPTYHLHHSIFLLKYTNLSV